MATKPAPAVLNRLQRLFRGRENAFGQWKEGAIKTVESPITEKEWLTHLGGKGPILGIIPITETNDCYFGAIDVDDDTVNHAALAGIVEHARLPLVVCRSKSGGAHLYLFLLDPAPAKLVKEKLTRWAGALQLKNPPYKNGSPHPLEIFPKQIKLAPDVTGNWINLPYYGNGSTQRYAVTADGTKLSITEFLDYAESKAISATTLEALEADVEGTFRQGPPCLKTLDMVGIPEGGRNMGMFNIGVYFKLSDPENWKERLKEYNSSGKIDPPLKGADIKALIRSLESKDYQYKCDDIPISPHCKKAECKKQKYGIGGFRLVKLAGSMPELGNLRKVMTDPPRWILSVNGSDVDLQTDDLMLIPRLRRAIMDKCSLVFPVMKQHEWDDQLSQLLQNHTVIEAPDDAGVSGVFQYLFRDFLRRRTNARTKDDLLGGLPFEEGGKVYFRSIDLIGFLERKKFREYDSSDVFITLRRLGAGHTKWNVKNQGLQLWFIETPSDDQDQDFEHVVVDESPEA